MEYASGGNQCCNSTNQFNSTNIGLRFRPIAPKPTPGGSNASSITTNTIDSKRTKRRYSRVNRASRSKRKSSNDDSSSAADPEKTNELVTLQLLPSEPVRSSCSPSCSSIIVPDDDMDNCRISGLNFSGEQEEADPGMMRLGFAAEVWVTVECVTGVSTEAFPCTDEVEVIATLSRDTCPAFVTNGCDNSVQWVNDALKEMVGADRVTLWLEVGDGVVLLGCGAAFTCTVRLRYMASDDGTDHQRMLMRMVPCDAYRVQSGGLAWRLDVRAGLSLSLD